MTIDRTFHPRAWATAAGAAFVSGLATTGVAFALGGLAPIEPPAPDHSPPGSPEGSGSSPGAPRERTAPTADPTKVLRRLRAAGVIALRTDPANPNLLVVDFAIGRPAGAGPGGVGLGLAGLREAFTPTNVDLAAEWR